MITSEGISKLLHDTLQGIVPLYFAEAETNSYPYAVYDHIITPHFTKDGIYKITSDCTITIFAEDEDTCVEKAGLVEAAISSDMNSGSFSAQLRSTQEGCDNKIWTYEMNYLITERS